MIALHFNFNNILLLSCSKSTSCMATIMKERKHVTSKSTV